MKYYLKFLGNDRQPYHGGIGQWPEPLTWTETIENPVPCQSGYHLCRKQDIFWWCEAPTLWVVKAEGAVTEINKVVASRARLIRQVDEWNECNQRLFAVDCAERVLDHFEKRYPGDKRPRKAIETARRYAKGQATEAELVVAQSDAGAAGYACYAATIEKSAGFAAYLTTWAPLKTVTEVTYHARCVVRMISELALATEYDWQINHLLTHHLKLNPEEFA